MHFHGEAHPLTFRRDFYLVYAWKKTQEEEEEEDALNAQLLLSLWRLQQLIVIADVMPINIHAVVWFGLIPRLRAHNAYWLIATPYFRALAHI